MTRWLADASELGDYLGRYTRSLFRMERMPEYAVYTDGDDFHRWVDGEPEPTWSRLEPWLEHLRTERASGKELTRVRVFSEQLTRYERYSCEWGYVHTGAAGEDIRVLHVGEHQFPSWLGVGDWWLMDDAEVVSMRYDGGGRFEGAEVLTKAVVGVYRDAAAAAWALAEPFADWWERHPELRRTVAA